MCSLCDTGMLTAAGGTLFCPHCDRGCRTVACVRCPQVNRRTPLGGAG